MANLQGVCLGLYVRCKGRFPSCMFRDLSQPRLSFNIVIKEHVDFCSVVDFGPGWYNLSDAFGAQRKYNAPGKSPPLCAEF